MNAAQAGMALLNYLYFLMTYFTSSSFDGHLASQSIGSLAVIAVNLKYEHGIQFYQFINGVLISNLDDSFRCLVKFVNGNVGFLACLSIRE